jgi:hypothetical protein
MGSSRREQPTRTLHERHENRDGQQNRDQQIGVARNILFDKHDRFRPFSFLDVATPLVV